MGEGDRVGCGAASPFPSFFRHLSVCPSVKVASPLRPARVIQPLVHCFCCSLDRRDHAQVSAHLVWFSHVGPKTERSVAWSPATLSFPRLPEAARLLLPAQQAQLHPLGLCPTFLSS